MDHVAEFLKSGVLHRLDGPARVLPDGTEEWYRSGLRHRDDGPALIHPDGSGEWFWDGYPASILTSSEEKIRYAALPSSRRSLFRALFVEYVQNPTPADVADQVRLFSIDELLQAADMPTRSKLTAERNRILKSFQTRTSQAFSLIWLTVEVTSPAS